MHHRLTPEQVAEKPAITEILEEVFDLILPAESACYAEQLFVLQDGRPYQVVAQQASGDFFVLCPSPERDGTLLLYVCHEGSAGVIAADFHEAIQIIIALPYWGDLLKFSAGGQLNIMRQAAASLETELCEELPELNELREQLFRELHLEPLPDPINTLYEHVRSSDDLIAVLSPEEGNRFDGLFGTWVYRGS